MVVQLMARWRRASLIRDLRSNHLKNEKSTHDNGPYRVENKAQASQAV